MMRTTARGKIAIDSVNKAWRSPKEEREPAASAEKLDEAVISEEEEEAWLDTVNASAVESAKEAQPAEKQLQNKGS